MPKYTLPDDEMPPRTAYQLIHDELMLDGNARLNLATFVTTWMEPEAERLMAETFDKNMIDKDEYPQTAEIETRCVNMIARLFNAPEDGEAVGVSAIGSSEAVMLAGMALKWRWRARREAAGQPADKPNLIMGANVQVVWEKFCRYWEVEPRYIPMQEGRYVITPEEVVEPHRREHHRRGRHPRHHLHRRVRAHRGDPRCGGRAQRRARSGTCRCTSTRPAAASSPRSSTPICAGTSACPTSSPSTPRATSTGWSIRASAGPSGAARSTCPRTWCSTSTTWAATCPPSR